MMAADAGCWAPNRSPEPVEGRVKRVARVVRRAHHGGVTAVCLSLSVAMASAGTLRAQPPEADAAAKADRRAADKQRRASPGNLVGHGGPIKALAVDAATGRALTGSFDYAMMVWDVVAEEPRRLARLDDHAGAVNAVAFMPGSNHSFDRASVVMSAPRSFVRLLTRLPVKS